MKRQHSIWRLVLLLAVVLAYANSFNNAFQFDDHHTVINNPAIRSLRNLPRFFTDATTFSVLPSNQTYRPMVSASLALDYAMGHGYVPKWFHLSTFLLFVLLVALLAELYGLIFRSEGAGVEASFYLALAGAAWFGLHPAMAETVNYIIQRGDLYCTLGCVAALVVYARFPALRKLGLYLLPLVFAMLSKPPAAVFPLLLFAYVWFFEADDERWHKSAVAALPSALVVGALLALQHAMTPRTFAPSYMSPRGYRLVQPYVWLRYFSELFLPLHLNVDTDLGPISHIFDPRALAGLAFLAALAVAVWVTSRRRRLYPIAFGLVWFVVAEFPTSVYPLSEVENDHRMFLPFPGLILAGVWAVWLLAERLPAALRSAVWMRPVAAVLVVSTLSGYAYGVHVRNQVWHDEESLWRDDVQKSPHNGRGLMNYGLALMSRGAYPQALGYFTRALEYTPNYPTLEINLGIVNGAMADHGDAARGPEAERHFLRAISLGPSYDGPHSYYGRWLKEHGRTAEAIAQLREAIALNPVEIMPREELIDTYTRAEDAKSARQAAQDLLAIAPDDTAALQAMQHPPAQTEVFWINLSLTQYQQGQYPQAIMSAQKALALDPKSALAYNNIGAAEAGMRQWDEAIRNEQEAVRLDPQLQIAQNNLRAYMQERDSHAHGTEPISVADQLNLSMQLNQAGKYDESIAAGKKAVQLDPSSAIAWNNIAAGYEAEHRWDEAIAAAQKAVALQPDFQLAKNNLAWSIAQKKTGRH
jgi:tetratricopeptide (TPR) repeat protein